MTITITPEMLCDLCGGKFTLKACEAICNYFDEGCEDACPRIGDIYVSFEEIPQNWLEEENEDDLIAVLDNGNALIAL